MKTKMDMLQQYGTAIVAGLMSGFLNLLLRKVRLAFESEVTFSQIDAYFSIVKVYLPISLGLVIILLWSFFTCIKLLYIKR